MKRLFAVAGALLLAVTLAGCSVFGGGDVTPPQQAATLNDVYQAVAEPAARCIETPACKAKAGDEIKAADSVAFAYVARVTAQAKAWNDAPDDQKPAKADAFEQILGLAKEAVAALAGLIKG